jgi:competence protein ComEC
VRIAIILVALALLQAEARPDYLEVRRSATIKADPNGQAQIHEHVQPPVHLALIPLPDEVNDQRSGYYLVARPGGGQGWIYRTLVRRYAGTSPHLPPSTPAAPAPTADSLELHFIDVGQGDSTLVKCPGGFTILVDCGSTGGGDPDVIRAYLLDQLDPVLPRIDALVITHPDRDHYNLLPEVLAGVQVDHIYKVGPPVEHDANDTDVWLLDFPVASRTIWDDTAFDAPGSPNAAFNCGAANVYLLAANIDATRSPSNARSIVLLIDYLDFEAVLTGDATFDTEAAILDRYPVDWLDVDVLKLGHHGSSTTSTGSDWLAAVRPELAVVSASHGNSYGHPRRSVIEAVEDYTDSREPHRLRWGWSENNRAQYADLDAYVEAVYSTATSGTVVVTSNGQQYEIRTER